MQAYDGGELVVEMVVCGGCGGLYDLVCADFGLLAGLAALLGDEVGYGLAVDCEGLELIDSLELVGHGEVHELVGECHEACVLGNEVGLAVEGEDSCELAVCAGDDATLRSLAVFALCGYGLTLLAKNLDSGLDVAVSLGESFLAVHQAGACEVAQLGDFCHCYCHIG